MKVSALIAAAGVGRRFGAEKPKQFIPLGGSPILEWSIEAFSNAEMIREIIIVAPPQDKNTTADMAARLEKPIPIRVFAGGPSRQDSVRIGLGAVDPVCEWVAVHDAARPLVSVAQIESVCLMAQKVGAAILALPVRDTVKTVDSDGLIVRTIDRSNLYLAQTPQVIRKEYLRSAYDLAEKKGIRTTDEAGLLEAGGIAVGVVEGSPRNLKITTAEDLELAQALIESSCLRPGKE